MVLAPRFAVLSVFAANHVPLIALPSDSQGQAGKPNPAYQVALDAISADSMRGHLSFVASDLLEGRGTPSKGLDIAAEYIAAQFRRARLTPGLAGSFFQKATWKGAGGAEQSASNVIGVLEGSDPKLKDTYVIVSSHYDHVGMKAEGEGDRIFNGANDDGSGTVSVIEIASALAKLNVKPKRSIVFMCFYGEERGLLGSRWYGEHPVFPIERTVAQINLEHMGRTDDMEGARIGAASMTGFDYSDIGPVFVAAGKQLGIKVEKHPRNSDLFFGASDNQSLANLGVPAHSLCTSFIFPDYHGLGDHWDKVDYENMAKVDRMVALGVLTIADSVTEPKWNQANPRAKRYLDAWTKRRAGQTNHPRS